MLLFRENMERSFSRNNALGMKTLEISEDVNVADAVSIGVDTDRNVMLVLPSDEDEDENGDFVRCLTKTFGVFGNIENTIEVIECDDILLINLIKGAIFVDKPDEDDEKMLVFRGINTDKLGNINTEEIVWFDTDKIQSFTQYFGKYSKQYSLDYIHTVTISIRKNGELSVKRVSEEDISLGGFEILDRKEQARQARVALIRAEKERQEQARKLEQEEYDDYDEDDSYDDEYDNEDDDYDLYV